jgi:hypothetical protein
LEFLSGLHLKGSTILYSCLNDVVAITWFYTLWIFKAEAVVFQITFVIKNYLKNMENNLNFRIFHRFTLQSNCHSCNSMIQVKATPKRWYNVVLWILCTDMFSMPQTYEILMWNDVHHHLCWSNIHSYQPATSLQVTILNSLRA